MFWLFIEAGCSNFFKIIIIVFKGGGREETCFISSLVPSLLLPFHLTLCFTPWLRSSISYLNEEMFHVVCFIYLKRTHFRILQILMISQIIFNFLNQICGTKHTFSVTQWHLGPLKFLGREFLRMHAMLG